MTNILQPDHWPADARFSYGQPVKAIIKREGQPRFPGFIVGWYEPLDKRHAGWAVEHYIDGLIHVYPDKALEERPDKLDMVLIVQVTVDGSHGYGITTPDVIEGCGRITLAGMMFGGDDRVDTFDCIDGIKQHVADCDARLVDIVVAEQTQ